jgi:hypothetical protein
VGRKGVKKQRKKLPPKQVRDFNTREAAKDFIANLRREFGDDEVAATIIELRAPSPSPPQERMLAGHWPYQTRDVRSRR